MVYVVVSTKGGSGKTTIARHILPTILEDVSILEIDDNNNTSEVFGESRIFVNQQSVNVNDGESAFHKLRFELLKGNVGNLIVDAGGGNDTKTVIETIKGITSRVTYIVPVMASMSQAKNAVDTAKLLEGEKVVFALNACHNPSRIEDEFLFWFGSKQYGVESIRSKIDKDVQTIVVPYSHLFELASAKYGVTLAELAHEARSYVTHDEAGDSIFARSKDHDEPTAQLKRFSANGKFCQVYLKNSRLLPVNGSFLGKKMAK